MSDKNIVVESTITNFLTWLRRVIEEADKPLSLLLMVMLPLVAPIIPSIITSMNLEKYMDYTPGVAIMAAVVFALVGYVSMITAIGAVMRYVENESNDREWLPVLISVGSYLVYVFALVTVNVVLEQHNGVDGVTTMVTALMTLGLEVPSALLNGTRINSRLKTEETDKYDDKEKSFELEKLRLESETRIALANAKAKALQSRRKSHSPSRSQSQSQDSQRPVSKSLSTKRAPSQPLSPQPTAGLSGSAAEIFALMDKTYVKEKRVVGFSELTAAGYEKSTASRYRSKWLEAHPEIKKPLGF